MWFLTDTQVRWGRKLRISGRIAFESETTASTFKDPEVFETLKETIRRTVWRKESKQGC